MSSAEREWLGMVPETPDPARRDLAGRIGRRFQGLRDEAISLRPSL